MRILQPLRTAEDKLARKRSVVDPAEGLDPTETPEPEAPMPKLSTIVIAQTGRLPCYKREPRQRACTGSPKPKEPGQ